MGHVLPVFRPPRPVLWRHQVPIAIQAQIGYNSSWQQEGDIFPRPLKSSEKRWSSRHQLRSQAAPEEKEEYTDEELFSSEMRDVQEIEAFRTLPCARHHHRKPITSAERRDPDDAALTALGEIAAGHRPMHLPDTQEYVEWVSPEYHDTILPELHAGRFSVQAFLDLHGCTVAEADDELAQFLDESFKKGCAV
jgi:DNA-nicking Smr family endonuclease